MANRMRPYQHWDLIELGDTLTQHVERLSCADEMKRIWIDLINEAIKSKDWNVLQDYNGCTMFQDHLHPDPACFIHDYSWITGRGGAVSDRVFYHMMLAEGMTKSMARFRWFAVRCGWVFYFYWKYIKQRKLKPVSKNMARMDQFLKDLK